MEARTSSEAAWGLAGHLPRAAGAAHDGHRIVIVGGGAGGLELAVRLGESRGDGKIRVVLVDERLTHFWKPLLHEVAAGTLPAQVNQAEFLQQAYRHGFRFHLGRMTALDRSARCVHLAPLRDDAGGEIAGERTLAYDTLVLALGSIVNDFGTPGVAEHAARLDNDDQARCFHRRLLAECARAESTGDPVDIVIAGGGTTGVELAAELHEAVREIANFGVLLSRMPSPVRITIVEAEERLLPALPDEVARRAQSELEDKGVQVRLGQRVTAVAPTSVTLADGTTLAADLCVWAAGIQGTTLLAQLDGLEVNRRRQLVVQGDLRTTRDPDVLAIGDCASVRDAQPEVPATAQAAQQQAEYLARTLSDRLAGRPLPPFRYRNRGTLVSLGSRAAAGDVVWRLTGRRFVLYGFFARVAYWAAQRRHLATLYGFGRAALMMLGNWLAGRGRGSPRVKLH